MRKFIFSFGVICTVTAAAFLGGCSKNSECGTTCCDKEKAAVKTDAEATPAAKSGCAASCAEKKAGCCQKKAACPASGNAQ